MKLAEVEERMMAEGFSEELFLQFQEGLKRVRGNYNKCQHCYLTAYGLKAKDFEAAIRMIRYGLENFAELWVDFSRSYDMLARIYIRRESYREARACYLASFEKMVEFGEERHGDVLAVNLVFSELHCEGFTCTDNLRKFHDLAQSDLAKSGFTRRDRFYFALAELVIALQDQGVDGARSAYRYVMCVLMGLDPDANDALLQRHRYRNDAYATGASLRYLDSLGPVMKGA